METVSLKDLKRSYTDNANDSTISVWAVYPKVRKKLNGVGGEHWAWLGKEEFIKSLSNQFCNNGMHEYFGQLLEIRIQQGDKMCKFQLIMPNKYEWFN